MSAKQRVLRVGCISLLLLGFVGYFAFSTFFFPLFEGRFKADVAGLIPRTVDVYLAREDLEAAFDGFPTLAVAEELKDNTALRTYLESPEWQRLNAEKGITKTFEDVKSQLAQLPLGIDLLDIAGGEDLALAANFVGSGIQGTEWAVYARASRYGKLAVSALKHPGLIGLEKQGLSASQSGEIITLTGGQLAKPIHIARILDVIVAGTSLALVQEAVNLEAARSEGSLLLAAPYADSIASVDRNDDKRDIEVQFDLRKMREQCGMTKPWPDPASNQFAPAFFGRLLPVAAVRRLLGIIDFDHGLSVDLSGEFSSELMTAAQERVYRAKEFDQEEVMDVAGFVADDATLFSYLRGPIATILDMVLASLEPAAAENLNDVIRAIGYGSTSEFIQALDSSLYDRVAFVARPNDWGDDDDIDANGVYVGPPHDDTPVFAWAVIVWMKDEKKLEEIREQIAQRGSKIGIQGREPGSNGYYLKRISGGLQVREFWSPFIPGTGHIAVLFYGDTMIISNRYAMINELTENRVQRGSNAPLLKNLPAFQYMLQDSSATANLLTWVNPRTGTDLLLQQAKRGASGKIESSIDYTTKRREEERKVLQTVFGGKPRSGLTADEAARLDQQVDQNVRLFRDEVIEANLPRELAAAERMVAYLRGIAAGLTMIKLSPKDFKLSIRVDTPYGD
ncbi:hypothetical protein Poly30_44980 [Planctomycetes bacterium Poly30]|uniref:DUF3352 domain-containing protein n=1 Tax=Saltatorellus ferox TaxID=2528018 RepID=A0A518EXY1_9BACT|nr:hypothetical protein Poly30_44980 [Planctomycetes bacterium Poly30]